MTNKTDGELKPDGNLNVEANVRLRIVELNTIFNVLGGREYRPGDGEIVMGILRKIRPFIVIDTNISPGSHEEQLKDAEIKAGRPQTPNITITKKQN